MMRPIFFSVAQTLPAAPTLISAVAPAIAPPAPLQIRLTYQRNSSNEIGFLIQRSEVAGGPFATVGSALANSASYTDTTVGQGRTYYYQVVAYNAQGNSPASNVMSATTAARIPSAPTGLIPVATATPSLRVNLTWNIADANLTGAVIQRATNSGFTANLATFSPVAANPTSYSDLTVAPSTTYYYRVATVNAVGQSAWSPSVIVATPGSLAAPTNLRTSLVVQRTGGLNNGRVIISWNATAGAQGYQVWRSVNNGAFVQVGTTNLTTFQNSNLGAGTYRSRVLAYNGATVSPYSNIITVQIN
jgi:fibronectin type 3 domain-containing protein